MASQPSPVRFRVDENSSDERVRYLFSYYNERYHLRPSAEAGPSHAPQGPEGAEAPLGLPDLVQERPVAMERLLHQAGPSEEPGEDENDPATDRIIRIYTDLAADSDKVAVINFLDVLNTTMQTTRMSVSDVFEKYVRFYRNIHKGLNVDHFLKQTEKGFILTLFKGRDENLPVILLNAPLDITFCEERLMVGDPDVSIDTAGDVFSPGAQTVCNAIQYIEALWRLQKDGVTLRRSICITQGLQCVYAIRSFLEMTNYEKKDIYFVLDAGIPSPDDTYILVIGEKPTWNVTFTCPGTPQHASEFLDNTPDEKLRVILNKILDFRDEEKQKLIDNPALTKDDVVAIHLTRLQGGVQDDVVPSEFLATFDIRFPTHYNHTSFERKLNRWAAEANVTLKYSLKQVDYPVTQVSEGDVFLETLRRCCSGRLKIQMAHATRDGTLFRAWNVPVYGFSPIINTKRRTHANEEYLNVHEFLRGINIYYQLLKELGGA